MTILKYSIILLRRYDAERLGNGLARVRPLRPDDPVLMEGYFPKLTDSTSGRVWGTRQAETKLMVGLVVFFPFQNNTQITYILATHVSMKDINRQDDTTLPPGMRTISLESFRRYRDRIMEAIDKGTYLAENGQRVALTIDILGKTNFHHLLPVPVVLQIKQINVKLQEILWRLLPLLQIVSITGRWACTT